MNVMASPILKVVKKDIITLGRTYRRSFKGDGEISGVISIQGEPTPGFIIQLFHNPSNYYIRSTISGVDGSYVFHGLDRTQQFDVIAADPNQKWEKRISSRRVPYWKDPQFSYAMDDGANAEIDIKIIKKPVKFWRIYITASQDSDNVSVSELEMFESESSTNLCVGGTASADVVYSSSWEAEYAFDGVKGGNSGWSAIGALPHWLQYELPVAKSVTKIGLTARDAGSGGTYAPINFIIQSSEDGIVWEDMSTVSGVALQPNEERFFSF